MNKLKKLLLATLCGAFVMGISGCQEEEGPAEKAGKEIDKAASEVSEGMKNLGQDLKNATN